MLVFFLIQCICLKCQVEKCVRQKKRMTVKITLKE